MPTLYTDFLREGEQEKLGAAEKEQIDLTRLREAAAGDRLEASTVKAQFASHDELQETLQRKLEKSTVTYAARLPAEQFEGWVHDKHLSFSKVAREAAHAGLSPQATGTLVHRVAELRTLAHQQHRLLNGERFVEFSPAENGGELDLITVRGDRHYIHDYKPINLADTQNKPWSADFNRWLTESHGGDYTKIGNFGSMSPDLHHQFRSFLAEAVAKHKEQLQQYCDLYANAGNLARHQVIPSVYPYYVWR